MDTLRREVIRGPHAYVWVLGVEPRAWRQGIGGSLLKTVCARCDEAAPCVLETEKSVRGYEQHGFCIARAEAMGSLGYGPGSWSTSPRCA